MFVCIICNKSYKNKNNLVRHMSCNCKKRINKNKIQCDKCFIKFSKKDSLIRHKNGKVCKNEKVYLTELFSSEVYNSGNEIFKFYKWY